MRVTELLIDGDNPPVVRELTPEEVAALPQPTAPAEVPMHKVEKAAILMPWPGYSDLEAAILDAISQLPAPKDRLAMKEWGRAPNLQREGATTLGVMAILGMTEAQRDDLLNFAASLP